MKLQLRSGLLAAAMLAALTPAFAQRKTDTSPIETKEQAHARMSELQSEIATLRANYAPSGQVGRLQAEFDALSAWLGGDVPARTGPQQLSATPMSGSQLLSGPACGASTTTTNFAGTTGAILPTFVAPGLNVTTVVSGVDTYLWDVKLNTSITHTWSADLDITLESPSGTIVTITTDNGGSNDNCFNGTVWDEQTTGQLNTVVDRVYANNVTSTPLNAEGRLSAFRGENPNGTWTLHVIDDLGGDTGTLNAWSLDITTLVAAPVESTSNFTTSPALAISTAGTPLVTSSLLVSGVGTYASKVTLFVEIPHANAADLDITLTSPTGTIVKVTTDNGGTSDNVFNGTLFTGSSTINLTDFVYVNNVTAPTLSPEGAFDNFLGQDPNGTWTLNVQDDLAANGGTLVRWDLDVTTTTTPSTTGPTNFAGATGAIPEAGGGPPATPTIFTNAVSGVGTVLWDVDLTTVIAHTSGADLDMTLTSPAGTVVTISTDNGGTNDNVFNGTLWDSNANDGAADHIYANNVAATPLTPEGSTTAFRGEDPNGVWTLTITDDATGADFGSLNAWSLDIATIPTLPIETLTTVSQSPGLVISAAGTPTVSDSMVVAGAGTAISSLTLYVEIPHTFSSDLVVSLTSPGGTVLNITSANGGGNDDVFNGATFDWDTTDSVTDHVYANAVIATPLSPETGMDNLLGQDPNGSWTLTVFDSFNLDGGTLVRWDLNIKTCPTNGASFCSNDTFMLDHTTPCPCTPGAPGNGCAHSFDPNGANMSVFGTIAADDIVLHSQFEPASSFTLMMQHGNAGDSVFHDGVLCAANPLIRLRGRAAVGGEAFFPNSLFANDSTTTLSARGGTFVGSGATMRYAAWYRNASTTFCPPATANVTNGWVITW